MQNPKLNREDRLPSQCALPADYREAAHAWHLRGLMHPLELQVNVTERLLGKDCDEITYADFFVPPIEWRWRNDPRRPHSS